MKDSLICNALYAKSLIDLLTLIELLSLKYLLISPDYHWDDIPLVEKISKKLSNAIIMYHNFVVFDNNFINNCY